MGILRKHLSAVVVATAAALALTACGSATASKSGTPASTTPAALTKVTVGASPVPHAKILQFVKDKLATAAGLDIKIVEYDDYVQPNEALASGELDANYFQHLPYLQSQIKDKGYKFEHGAGVHIEPYAAFSKKYKSLTELPDGRKLLVSRGIGLERGRAPRLRFACRPELLVIELVPEGSQ